MIFMSLHGPNVPYSHQLDDLRGITITYIMRRNLLRLGAIILFKLQVTRYFNATIGFIVVSISLRVIRITNKDTLYSSRFEFTELPFCVLDEAFAPEDAKVEHIGLLPGEKLVWCLVVERTEEEPV